MKIWRPRLLTFFSQHILNRPTSGDISDKLLNTSQVGVVMAKRTDRQIVPLSGLWSVSIIEKKKISNVCFLMTTFVM